MVIMNNQWKNDGKDEEEDVDLDDTNYTTQKDALLFAIEINDSMLGSRFEKNRTALAAMKCAYQIMQQQIISRPKDMIGVLLFGTEKTKLCEEEEREDTRRSGLEFPHCYLLIDLSIPSSEAVKLLKSISMGEDTAKDILVPNSNGVSMSDMLFCANQIFTTRAANFGSRRLFIITNQDDPHPGDKAMRSQAAVRARDLYDLGVIIELFPISHANHEFDRTKFYDDIVYRDPAEETEDKDMLATHSAKIKISDSEDGIALLSQLISDINSKQVAKRALFSGLPFEIGPGLQISVSGFNLIHKQRPSQSCWVYDGGEELKLATMFGGMMTEDTANAVDKSDIRRAYKFGGSQVFFTEPEEKVLKFFESPILRIIGFKSKEMLPFWASIHKSTFIYPSEENFVGSTRVFSALWAKLLRDNRIGIAWYISRSNASPALVAVLPSQETLPNKTQKHTVPAGLWLYTLPYRDDLRSIPPIPAPLTAPDNLIDQIRIVIQQLQLPGGTYDPFKYPNPALQWHYRVLQAMALDDEITETTPDDKTKPRYRQIEKRAGHYMKKWRGDLEEKVRIWQKNEYGLDGTSNKRPRDESSGSASKKVGGSRKKIKKEETIS